MKKIIFISVLTLILMMVASSCKKEDGGPVTDEKLTIQAVKTRIDLGYCYDGGFGYDLNTTSSARISTSEGTFSYYYWKSSEDLSEWVKGGLCERLACAYPTVYGEEYTRLNIVANKAVTAQVVTTADNKPCVTLHPANDGKSFEVKYDASSVGTGNGAAYILIRSTDGESAKLISVGAFKTLPQIMESFPTTLSYEIYESDTVKKIESQTIAAVDNDTTSIFSVDSGYVLKFKGIQHAYKNDYDVHNFCVAKWLDTLRTYQKEPKDSLLFYSGCLIDVGKDNYYKCVAPGYVTMEIRCNKVDSTQGKVKSQWFTFKVNKKKD